MLINYEMLMIAVKDVILEDKHDSYDFNIIVGAAQPCWDGTGILVKSTDFEAVFDATTYDCLSVDSFDLTQ